MIRQIELLEQQAPYSDATVGPAFDTPFDPPLSGFEVTTAGDVEVVTAGGSTVVIPAATGRIYPILVAQISASNTTVAQADIIGYIQ